MGWPGRMSSLFGSKLLHLSDNESLGDFVAECADSWGLAYFLRKSLQGEDLVAEARQWMQRVASTEDAGDWRDAALAMFCVGQEKLGMDMLCHAVQLSPNFRLRHGSDAPLRLLMLMSQGTLDSYTPIECLLDDLPVCVFQSYVSVDQPVCFDDLPEHDLLWMAVAESPAQRSLLYRLQHQLEHWPRPVIHAPERMLAFKRDQVAQSLEGIKGLLVPQTRWVPRTELEQKSAWSEDCLLRPMHSQGGHGLARITSKAELNAYLLQQHETAFYCTAFVDYRNAHGWYGKMRIALLNGQAYPCHYAFSEQWMVHYVNARMYDEPSRRKLEEAWMQGFEVWNQPYRLIWPEIQQRLGLEYVLLDLAELPDGQLVLFEADPAMVAHRMDYVEYFPYKQEPMRRLQEAVLAWLKSKAAAA